MKKCTLILFCLLFPYICHAAEATPKVAAHGAVLMDAQTGRVLWGKNEHEPLSMASTTKIMTAVLALESGRLDEIATVSAKAAAAPKVKMNLSKGEKVRLGDLLLALMLESSNDAAVAIAEHLSPDGTVKTFCEGMTQKAKEIGAKNTVFLTPNGLDYGQKEETDENWHHSTAFDLGLITRYALQVPGFIKLTNTSAAAFASDRRSYHFNNRNRLLHEYQGANGVKTGFTNKAGHCFVGAAKRDDMQLISVVLASGWGERGKAQKWVDTKSVLNHGFNHFEYETIVNIGDVAGTVPVTRSRTDSVEYAYENGLRLPINQQEKESIQIELDVPGSLLAPVTQGGRLGTAIVRIGEEAYEIPLTALQDIDRHDLKTSLEKVLDTWLQQGIAKPVQVKLPFLE